MDVVYNHTMLTGKSCFNQLAPGYYYRHGPDGNFSNATACGNETASERTMMRKFMLESTKYWVQEYHIDGFRFDLMGVHDIVTMNLISRELHRIKPDILLYGEGWTAGSSPLPDSARALKANVAKLDRIAVFSDDIRDAIKGSVFDNKDRGFVSNKPGMEESIKFGIVASCRHPQIDYSKVNYSKTPYAAGPWNTITYADCHDNHTLWDKLAVSVKDATPEERKEMQKLALSIVLTSQGIPFLQAGSEFLRSKQGNDNSYNAGDSINAIDWSLKSRNKDVFDYVKALVRMRKEHPGFRMTTARQIAENIRFLDGFPQGMVAYTINGEAAGDSWKKILVLLNGTNIEHSIILPDGPWNRAMGKGEEGKAPGPQTRKPAPVEKIPIRAYSCNIYYK
jgi:pullulanase